MVGNILDIRQEGDCYCYLSKIKLADYIDSLPPGYKDYEVQREIVNNTYLDNLIETVLTQSHIPPIVLVLGKGNYSINDDNTILKISSFKILDGLQRTFRLKLIWDTFEFFISELKVSRSILSLTRIQLSRKYFDQLDKINTNSKILESIIVYYKQNFKDKSAEEIKVCFNVYQWFEIWTGLSARQEVNKMLILNAGHKPVKTKHQLELLFRSLLPVVKNVGLESFELIREKEMSSISYSKNRKLGQFHFSHLITSILSLSEGKPQTTNVGLVHKAQSEDFDFDKFDKYFTFEFLHKFISVLLELDKCLYKKYGDLGIKWIGREISLVGIFAALGQYSLNHNMHPSESINLIESKIIPRPEVLNLEDFERNRNSLDLSKVNIGTVNKNAVFNGVSAILEGESSLISWSVYFKGLTV